MYKRFLLAAAASAFFAVGMGALGGHALTSVLDERGMDIFQTAVRYHFYHTLGLGLIASTARIYPRSTLLRWSGRAMLAGIILFSGSLYALALGGARWLGAITPFGGLSFMTAWLLLAAFAWRLRETEDGTLE